MSIIVKSGQQISRCPLNNSSAKAMYSFSKAPRFAVPTPLQAGFYDHFRQPTRTTSFGKGNKLDISKLKQSLVAPNLYHIPSQFDDRKKGCLFGVGREKLYSTFVNPNGKQPLTPGPGSYQSIKSLDQRSYSFKGRPSPSSQDQDNEVPGPGTYEHQKLFNSSKYQVKSIAYKAERSRRFGTIETSTLSYETHHEPSRRYLNSKFRNSRKAVFSCEERLRPKRLEMKPGPGEYLLPSEFGVYLSKKAEEK